LFDTYLNSVEAEGSDKNVVAYKRIERMEYQFFTNLSNNNDRFVGLGSLWSMRRLVTKLSQSKMKDVRCSHEATFVWRYPPKQEAFEQLHQPWTLRIKEIRDIEYFLNRRRTNRKRFNEEFPHRTGGT
jgi:hypothetical protein